jgi:hypothetical protein
MSTHIFDKKVILDFKKIMGNIFAIFNISSKHLISRSAFLFKKTFKSNKWFPCSFKIHMVAIAYLSDVLNLGTYGTYDNLTPS